MQNEIYPHALSHEINRMCVCVCVCVVGAGWVRGQNTNCRGSGKKKEKEKQTLEGQSAQEVERFPERSQSEVCCCFFPSPVWNLSLSSASSLPHGSQDSPYANKEKPHLSVCGRENGYEDEDTFSVSNVVHQYRKDCWLNSRYKVLQTPKKRSHII